MQAKPKTKDIYSTRIMPSQQRLQILTLHIEPTGFED